MTDARDTIDFSSFVRPAEQGRVMMDLALDGVDCAACMDDIERRMMTVPGVVCARLNLTTYRLRLIWAPDKTDATALI
jgi:Cu2+-exporting ATPase